MSAPSSSEWRCVDGATVLYLRHKFVVRMHMEPAIVSSHHDWSVQALATVRRICIRSSVNAWAILVLSRLAAGEVFDPSVCCRRRSSDFDQLLAAASLQPQQAAAMA